MMHILCEQICMSQNLNLEMHEAFENQDQNRLETMFNSTTSDDTKFMIKASILFSPTVVTTVLTSIDIMYS